MEEGSLGAGRRCAPGGLLQDWMNLLLAWAQNWRWQVQMQLPVSLQVPEDVAQLSMAAEDWAGLVAGCEGGLV